MHRSDRHGNVALVTGASRGIGLGIAEGLAEAGYAVGICARGPEVEQAAADLAGRTGADVRGWQIDLADPAAVRRFVDQAVEAFGQVDVLVNNAGVNRAGSLLELSADDVDLILAVNVRSTLLAIQAAARHMVPRGSGRIVNIASWVGRSPVPGFVAYSASKAAVVSLTRGAALELADSGITVNAVSPGNVWTEIWDTATAGASFRGERSARDLFDASIAAQPIKRGVEPREIADAVLFFCRAGAASITGETLAVASGL